MSHLTPWIHSSLAQALGWALVHFVWEGAVLATVLMAMLRVFRAEPAQRRYTLACLILAAMPVAFAVTLAAIWLRRPLAVAVPIHWVAVAASAGPIDSPAPRFSWRGVLDRLPWLVPVWFVGVAIFYARGLAGWVAVRRMRRRGVCAPSAEWQTRLDELAARLRISRPVALLESCLADTPVLIGYLRPVILLPLGCLTGLSVAQVECILLHELAHVARHDYVVNLLQSLVEGLLFYHPAVWWVSRVVRAERENCCDDRVVELMGNARAYAATLAVLEERRALAPSAALAATGGNLMKRIRRLTMESRGSQPSVAPAFSAALLLVIFAAALTALPVKLPAKLSRIRSAPAPVRLAGFAVAQEVAPQISTPYRKWLTEDVAYIITDQERAAFSSLTTDAERENFIGEFWKRRDPSPDTEQNEFREEHYRRIAYANEHFASPVSPGWKTDRGRTYIVYGPPDEIDDHSSGGTYRRPPEEGGATAETSPFQQWRYRFIDGMGNNVTIEFVDPAMSGEYRMTTDPNDKVKTPYRQWLLEDAAYIITPEERVQFRGLRTDAEREQFIADFWQRRGAAFREEHYRRMAYANEHFQSGIPGWKTDMGRIYIMYGPPDAISQMGAAAIQWSYRHVDGVGDSIGVVFENQGNGEYRMRQDPAPPKQEPRAAKVFASNDRTAVSVIVPGRGTSGVIAMGDVLDVKFAAPGQANLINLSQAIETTAAVQDCAALLSRGYTSEHPEMRKCASELNKLERLASTRRTNEFLLETLAASTVRVQALEQELAQHSRELVEVERLINAEPVTEQAVQQLSLEVQQARLKLLRASTNGENVSLTNQAKAELETKETELAKYLAENHRKLPEQTASNLQSLTTLQATVGSLSSQLAHEQQQEAQMEKQQAAVQAAQSLEQASVSPAALHADTRAVLNEFGHISIEGRDIAAAGLTPAQVAAAVGEGATVRIAQSASQTVTVLVPLPTTRDRFHVFGEVKDNRGKIVQTFDGESTGQPALARAVPLRSGSYHLIVVMKNLTSGETYRSELDFTVA